MTEIVIRINDENRIDSFLQMLKLFDFVTDVALRSDAKEAEARRERTLSFAGSWADMPQEEWEELQSHLKRRDNFFPERDLSW